MNINIFNLRLISITFVNVALSTATPSVSVIDMSSTPLNALHIHLESYKIIRQFYQSCVAGGRNTYVCLKFELGRADQKDGQLGVYPLNSSFSVRATVRWPSKVRISVTSDQSAQGAFLNSS